MKEKLNTKKTITSANIKKYLNNSELSNTIIWLLSLPPDELSDSMLKARSEMEKNLQNEVWLANYFEEKLKDELLELIEWNKNLI